MDAYQQAVKALALAPPFNKPSELDRVEALGSAGAGSGGRSEGKKSRARKGTGRGKKSKKHKGKSGAGAEASVQTFWSQVEDYFRDVCEVDLKLLEPRAAVAHDPQLAIPVLGRPYALVWQEEDAQQQRSTTAVQQKQSATVAKQKLLSASPVTKAKKRPAPDTSSAPLITSVLSPLEDDNDEPCDVCFEGESDDSNEIIFCDGVGCDVAVHQNCYGVATVPRGDEPWFCLRCSAPQPEAVSCVLCPVKKGAMKPLAVEGGPSAAGQLESSGAQAAVGAAPVLHAHLFCAQWVPETYIREGDGAIMNVGGVLKDRYKLTCVLCKVKQGVCIQCSHGQCAVAFHPLCARNNKLRMEIASREDSEEVELHAFCPKHSKERSSRMVDPNSLGDCQGGQSSHGVSATALDGSMALVAPALALAQPVDRGARTGAAALPSAPGAHVAEGPAGVGGQAALGAFEAAQGRPLQLRGGAPQGDETEDEDEDEFDALGQVPLGKGVPQYGTESEDGEGEMGLSEFGDGDEEDGEEGSGGEEGLHGSGLNMFELAVLAPEERGFLAPLEQAKVDNLLACLDSTVLIELAKGVMTQLNITQTALAHMAQISQSILSYWLGGRSRPSQEAINLKMRAFLRHYCVATEVAPTEEDEQDASTLAGEGQLPFYDVQGYYPTDAYALGGGEAGGGGDAYHANGGHDASSEGSELLHHLAARTAATTGRTFQGAPTGGGDDAAWAGVAAEAADEQQDEERRQRTLTEAASTSMAAGTEAGVAAGAVSGGGGRKASRSHRKRGGPTGGGASSVGRTDSKHADSSGQGASETGGLQGMVTAAASQVDWEQGAGSCPSEQREPALVEAPPVSRAVAGAGAEGTGAPPVAPLSASPAANGRGSGQEERGQESTPALAGGGSSRERGSTNNRVRGAARASAARAAAAAAAAAGGGAPPSGLKGTLMAGQKRAVAPKLSGPEEVHPYSLVLAGELQGGAEGLLQEGHTERKRTGVAGVEGKPGPASQNGVIIEESSAALPRSAWGDELSLAWQHAQLAAAHPLLAWAPVDEVVGELYAQQALLLAQARRNTERQERLLALLLPSLPTQLRGARVRAERGRLVEVYLGAEKEAKKADRKVKKDREAAALLAAATAAAAASPRTTHVRREGSLGAHSIGETGAAPLSAPGGTEAAGQQSEVARSALAGAAGTAGAKPPKAPGSGPRSGGQSKVRGRQKGEGAGAGAGPAARGAGQGAGPPSSGEGAAADGRSGRGKSVRPSLPEEWPYAASGQVLCAVCGQGESEPPNDIVFCERCNVAVHQECYGVQAIPAAPWWCQPCAYARQRLGPAAPQPVGAPGEPVGRGHPGVRCALCPGRTGALKRARATGPEQSPRWVHVFCAQWMPGTEAGKGEGALVEGLEAVADERRGGRCSLCGSKQGACLACSAARCSTKFHASCARNAHLAMSLQSTPEGRLLYQQYCQQHSAYPEPAPPKEAPLVAPNKEQELVKLKIIRVEFERVRIICDRVVRREKLKQDRARTSRELAAVQLALAHQALGGVEAPEEDGEQRPKRRRRQKNRDVLDGTASEGRAFLEHGHASVAAAGGEAEWAQAGGPLTSSLQAKRPALQELAGDSKRQRPSKLPRERLMTSQEANQNNRKLPAGFSYVPVSSFAPGEHPQEQWIRKEDGLI